MKTKLIIAALATAFTVTANAECIMRSIAKTEVKGKIDDIVEVQPILTTTHTEKICSIRARVLYQREWFTIMDTARGDRNADGDALCKQAVDQGVRSLLASKEPLSVNDEKIMACTDEEPPKPRGPVKVGDVIRISDYKRHPAHPDPIAYKGTTCRWFVETTFNGSRVSEWQALACQLNGIDDTRWTVVDKF